MTNSQSLEINVVFLCSFWFILLFLVGVTFAPTISNATANASGSAIDEAQDILSTTANATANATGELMSRADNVLSLASDAGSNATQTAMNKTMDLLTIVSRNVSDTMSNASTNETVLDVNEEANELINAASNVATNATNASVMTAEDTNTSNTILNGGQSDAAKNYTSNLYQIQFQYPSNWDLSEKTTRFDEGTDISVSSFSPTGYIAIQYLNNSITEALDFQRAVYEFFKSSIDSDYSKEYKVIEQPSFVTINNQKAGTYLYTHKDKYEDFATKYASQIWVVYVGNRGYLMSFMTSTNQFDAPEMKQIRDQFLKSIKFLGATNPPNSTLANRFD